MRKLPAKKKPAAKKKAKVKNVTPKTYAGVQYRSTLEAFTAQALEEAGLPINYETWKVVLDPKLLSTVESWEPKVKANKEAGIKVRTFAPISGNLRTCVYTPDFYSKEQGWVCEVKGMRTEAFNLRYRLFKRYLEENGMAHFKLYLPGNQQEVKQCITHILSNNKP